MAVYNRSANDQIFTAPTGGLYRVDAYGEQGGRTGDGKNNVPTVGVYDSGYWDLGYPGNGGKVTGYVVLKKGESIILQVAKSNVAKEYVRSSSCYGDEDYRSKGCACRGGRKVVVRKGDATLLIAPGGGGASAGRSTEDGGNGNHKYNGGAGGLVGGNAGANGEVVPAKGATQTGPGANGGYGQSKPWLYAPAAEGYYNGGCGVVWSTGDEWMARLTSAGGGASAYISPAASVTVDGTTYAASCVTGGSGGAAWAEVTLIREIKTNVKLGDKDADVYLGDRQVDGMYLGDREIY